MFKKFVIFCMGICFILSASFVWSVAERSTLQRDSFGVSIQGALRPIVAQTVNFTDNGSITNTADFQYPIIQITATQNCFVKLAADNTATAASTDHYVPKDNPLWIKVGPYLRIAAIRATDNGVLYISEMQ